MVAVVTKHLTLQDTQETNHDSIATQIICLAVRITLAPPTWLLHLARKPGTLTTSLALSQQELEMFTAKIFEVYNRARVVTCVLTEDKINPPIRR